MDLDRLSDALGHYFDREGFETNLDKSPQWYRVQARKKGIARTAVGAQRCIEVNIRGDPSTFEVEMTTSEWGKNLAAGAVLGAVTFGLGWVGAGLSAVTYRKLEESVFKYIHWQVDELKGTAAQPQKPISSQMQGTAFPTTAPLTAQCPKCNRQVKAEFNNCPFCGFNLRTQQLQCPRCTSPVEPSYVVCPNCGVNLRPTAATDTR